MYFLTVWDSVTDAADKAFRTFLLHIVDVIYRLIAFCFDVFNDIGTVHIFDNSDINNIYQRVGLVLAIFMIFRLSFSAIQYIVDPDSVTDKQKGAFNIIKKVVISIVLLGITPSIFDLAYDVQNWVTQDENVLGKVILGSDVSDYNLGTEFSWYMFSSFYQPNLQLSDDVVATYCPEWSSGLILQDYKNNNSLKYTYNCVNIRQEAKELEMNYAEYDNVKGFDVYIIDFQGLLAIFAGAITLWIIIVYTIGVGKRLFQLAFLQIIAPIPIMGYIAPKGDDMFKKWVKLCVTTYLDFFIRTAIIYFVFFVIQIIIGNQGDNLNVLLMQYSGVSRAYVIVILIIALLMFAKKATDLLKELFPSSGAGSLGFGLGLKDAIPDSAKRIFGFGAGAVTGAAVGAIGGTGIGGTITGFLGGLGRGAITGAQKGGVLKNMGSAAKKQAAANLKRANYRTQGVTWGERVGNTVRGALGRQEPYGAYDLEYARYNELYDAITGTDDVTYWQNQMDNVTPDFSSAVAYEQEAARIEAELNEFRNNPNNRIIRGNDETDKSYHDRLRLSAEHRQNLERQLDFNKKAAEQARTSAITAAENLYKEYSNRKDQEFDEQYEAAANGGGSAKVRAIMQREGFNKKHKTGKEFRDQRSAVRNAKLGRHNTGGKQ